MPPVTHALIGWLVANTAPLSRRDRALVTLAGVAPDLDGLSLIADFFAHDPSRPFRWWTEYHHVLGHNIFAAAGVALIVLASCQQRVRTTVLALVSFHLHLLCDVLGSGGPNGEVWDIAYLSPVMRTPVWSWSGQWRLDGWQNLLVTAVAIGATLWLALWRGFSPVSLFSERWDEKVVAVLRRWFNGTTAGPSTESASE